MPEEYTRKEAVQMIFAFTARMQSAIDNWDSKRWTDFRKTMRRDYEPKEKAPRRTANTDEAQTK